MEIGMVGSPAHVLTNEKIEGKNKAKVLGKMLKEDIKDTLTIAGTVAGTGAAVGAAAKYNSKFAAKIAGFASAGKEAIGKALSKVGIQKVGKGGKNYFVSAKGVVENKLKELSKDPNSLYSKFKGLPTYAKAGIAAGAAALAVIGNIVTINNVAKKGKIEGEAETKDAPKAKKNPLHAKKVVAAAILGLPAAIIAKTKAEKEGKEQQ